MFFSHLSKVECENSINLILNSLKNTNPEVITIDQFDKTSLFRDSIEEAKVEK